MAGGWTSFTERRCIDDVGGDVSELESDCKGCWGCRPDR